MDTQRIMDELARMDGELKSIASTRNGEGRFWKMLQIGTSILVFASTVVIVPFGVWTVQSIHTVQLKQTEFEGWKNQGPRFTPSDAEKLKLVTKDEIRLEIQSKLDHVADRLEVLTKDISEIKATIKSQARPQG